MDNTNTNTDLISNLLSERSNFILLGLTGRTGSGCTTTAKLLSGDSGELQFPFSNEVNYKEQPYFTGMDAKRYEIVRKYAVQNNEKFRVIKISELISAQILNLELAHFKSFIESVIPEELHQKIDHVLKDAEFIKSQQNLKKIIERVCLFFRGHDISRSCVKRFEY